LRVLVTDFKKNDRVVVFPITFQLLRSCQHAGYYSTHALAACQGPSEIINPMSHYFSTSAFQISRIPLSGRFFLLLSVCASQHETSFLLAYLLYAHRRYCQAL